MIIRFQRVISYLVFFAVVSHTSPLLSQSVSYRPGFDLSALSLTGGSVDYSSEFYFGTDLVFNDDGTRLYALGTNPTPGDFSGYLAEYELLVPFSLASASHSGITLDISVEDRVPRGLVFNQMGDKLFILGARNYNVSEYDLTIPFQASTASFSGNQFYIGNETTTPQDVEFSHDGMRMFVTGSDADEVFSYNLISPYQIIGAALMDSFSFGDEDLVVTDLFFDITGDNLYTITVTNQIMQYTLTDSYELSGALLSSTFDLSTFDLSATGVAFDNLGKNMYIMSTSGKPIRQFDVAINNSFEEVIQNDGSVSGQLPITLTGDTFVNAGGILTSPTHFTIDNLPIGLVPELAVDPDGQNVLLTLNGNASEHNDVNDVASMTFTFKDSAFQSNNAANVTGAVEELVFVSIDFDNNASMDYASAINLMIDNRDASFFVGNEDTSPQGFTFDDDGFSLFVVGTANDKVFEYELELPYDLATASASDRSLDLSAVDDLPRDVFFNSNGTYLFITGGATNHVYSFSLDTPFDITTATLDNSLDLSARSGSPGALTFNNTGTRMFVVGLNENQLFQYDMSTPYQLNTASYDNQSLNFSPDASAVTGLEFNANGSKLIVFSGVGDKFVEYNLSTPFNIATAAPGTQSDLVFLGDDFPGGLHISNTGNQFFMLGSQFNQIHELNLLPGHFKETPSNDGAVEGYLIIKLKGDTFINTGNILDYNIDYQIVGIPEGLNPVLRIAEDGITASLNFEGNALLNMDVHDTDNMLMTFESSAFVSSEASNVTNAIGGNTQIGFDFFGNLEPEVIKPKPDTIVQEGFFFFTIDLLTIFSDPDEDALTFTANSSNELAALTIIQAGSEVRISEANPGTSTITLTAHDGNGSTTEHKFKVTVNARPELVERLPNLVYQEGFSSFSLDLLPVFSDSDGDMLVHTVFINDETVATGTVTANTLTIAEVSPGDCVITVTAEDGKGGSRVEEFGLVINSPPFVTVPLEDRLEQVGFGSFKIILSEFFDDENSEVHFDVSSSDETVVTVSLDFKTITVHEVSGGTASVSIEVSDNLGGSLIETFKVTINSSPTVQNEIENQVANRGEGTIEIDVSNTFQDIDGDELTFAVESSNETVATVSIANQTLFINEVSAGTTTINLNSNDGKGGLTSTQFDFIINSIPIISNALDDRIEDVGFGVFELNLKDFFIELDGEPLAFQAISTVETVAFVSIEGSILSIIEKGPGETSIEITALDSYEASVSNSFDLTIVEAIVAGVEDISEKGIVTYPNPTNGTFTIAMNESWGNNSSIKIYDATGKTYPYSSEIIDIRTVKIDLTDSPSGMYFVNIQNELKQVQTVIYKK